MTIHSRISCSVIHEISSYLLINNGTLLDNLVRVDFLREAHLAFTLETPLVKHLLTFLVFLQARYVVEFELGIRWDVCLRSKDHHVANEGPAYKWIATMVYMRGAYPDADGTRFPGLESMGVATLAVAFVSKARETERIVE